MTIPEICFWAALLLVIYTYLGYGLVLWILLKLKQATTGKNKPEPILPDDAQLPEVTLMICAYNEEDVIKEKMQNIRDLDYPKEKLCVMWVTDGSNDQSNALLSKYDDIVLVYSPERKGKAAAMQHGLEKNNAEYVIFTDANTLLNSSAIREIVKELMKPNVSCVAGEKRVAARHEGQTAAQGEGLYWKYESTLKKWDSEFYSAMGAAGELFAVKMSDYRPAPSNALLDDFMISMLMVKDGHRIAYTSKAYAIEYGSADMHEESKRKRRIAAGGLQSIWWLRSLMNPFKYPVVSFLFISHRVLRWSVTPIALFSLLPLNILLILQSDNFLYRTIAVLQLIFYLETAMGWWQGRRGGKISKLLYIPYYFTFMNLNVFLGMNYLRRHKNSGTWEKARRG
jgi:cellulose synthase/poly-beta-1,6-N-acetylglucosamine synthase-like glycosyltransferase